MKNPFTSYRWTKSPWRIYPLLGLAWASIWQIHDDLAPPRFALSIANLCGALVCLLGMSLRDIDTARSVERWGYVALIWSLSCYLALALRFEGPWGLIHQTNLGIMLTEAIIVAAIHRTIYTIITNRKRRAKAKAEAALITDAQAIIKHYTEE